MKTEMIIEVLEWYRELAESCARYTEAKNTIGQTAIIVQLTLNAGNRATKAIKELNNLIK